MQDSGFRRAIDLSYGPPWQALRGAAAAIAYPVAEKLEQRHVRSKIGELALHYRKSAAERRAIGLKRLAAMLDYAGQRVPYYRDLYAAKNFDPIRVLDDPKWLEELPVLTKQILIEEGDRLLAYPLAEVRHHAQSTGGSTGLKATVYYDQEAADYSAAVTAYSRSRISGRRYPSTLHFAAQLPDTPPEPWPNRETFKCLATNRSNIFLDKLDQGTLDVVWRTIARRRPYLVQGHPSTLHALAMHLVTHHPVEPSRAFEVFESSGEVLNPNQRRDIAEVFGSRIVDRYGLAEFGVIAYDLDGGGLDVLDSECWIEVPEAGNDDASIIVTGLRNRLMPLVRYDTGDLGQLGGRSDKPVLSRVVGRVHDRVVLNGTPYLTHYLQDVIDHRIRGIADFQIDVRGSGRPILRLTPKDVTDRERIERAVEVFWPGCFDLEIVSLTEMVRVGDRAKFRHLVTA